MIVSEVRRDRDTRVLSRWELIEMKQVHRFGLYEGLLRIEQNMRKRVEPAQFSDVNRQPSLEPVLERSCVDAHRLLSHGALVRVSRAAASNIVACLHL